MNKKLLSLLLLAMFFYVSSCGTLMYKDRSFVEKSERIDYFVLGLDSMGLFVFVAPGILFLSIDYATGALWLSKEENARYKEEGLEAPSVRSIVFD